MDYKTPGKFYNNYRFCVTFFTLLTTKAVSNFISNLLQHFALCGIIFLLWSSLSVTSILFSSQILGSTDSTMIGCSSSPLLVDDDIVLCLLLFPPWLWCTASVGSIQSLPSSFKWHPTSDGFWLLSRSLPSLIRLTFSLKPCCLLFLTCRLAEKKGWHQNLMRFITSLQTRK